MKKILTFCTGGSGGIGKSTGARALAQALSNRGLATVLIDGDPAQQSQRQFFHLDNFLGIDAYHLPPAAFSLDKAVKLPNPTVGADAQFGVLPGPVTPDEQDANGLYQKAIADLVNSPDVDAIVVDCFRMSERTWDDPNNFTGAVTHPFMNAGIASIVYRIGSTGSQPQDGFTALAAIKHPNKTVVVAEATPGLVKPATPAQWSSLTEGMGRFAGVDLWTPRSADRLARGLSGYPAGSEPAWLKHVASFVHHNAFDWQTQRAEQKQYRQQG